MKTPLFAQSPWLWALSLVACLIVHDASASPHPAPLHSYGAMAPQSMLRDEELAQIRGGSLSIGTLQIDFGLTTRTLIDGQVEREITVDTVTLQGIDPASLRQIIQVGTDNVVVPDVVDRLPGLVTIIQNSVDSTVIQNFSILDVTASNLQDYHLQTLVPQLNQSAVAATH